MLPQDPVEAAKTFVDIVNRDDWEDHIDQYYAGQEWWEAWWESHRAFRRAFPDYKYTIEYIAAEGDIVLYFGTAEGTHSAEFPYGELKGIAASGNKCTWKEAWWFRTVDGKPVEGNLVSDGVARLQQIGVLAQDDA